MGMTITEYILAHAAGQDAVKPGEKIRVHVDVLLTHDVCGPEVIEIFKRKFGSGSRVYRRDGVVIIPGHEATGEEEEYRRRLAAIRGFVEEEGLPYFYDPDTTDYIGNCHEALPKRGHCRPGEVLFGTDPLTCKHGAFGLFASEVDNAGAAAIMGSGMHEITVPPSLKIEINGKLPEHVGTERIIANLLEDIGAASAGCALEFCGSMVEKLGLAERMTLCGMAERAGAVSAIVALDRKTLEYVKGRSNKPFTCFFSDPDAEYRESRIYQAEKFR